MKNKTMMNYSIANGKLGYNLFYFAYILNVIIIF